MTGLRSLLVVLLPGTLALRPGAPHDLHLSHTRMVVEGATITCRVRVFRDDTEAVLRRFTGRPDLRIADGSSQDSVFQRYIDARVVITAGGQRLRARVREAGRDTLVTDAPMWWYLVEYRAPRPVQAITVRHELMFEQFPDQRNILTVVKMPKEDRYSLYFAAGESREQVVKF